MVVPAVPLLLLEKLTMGELGIQPPDQRLYFNIADNFVLTGHFIQNIRPVWGMVVPPGTPFMLTLFRLLGMNNFHIMVVQIVMFGIANILLYQTEKIITGKGLWAPIIFTMAYLRNGFRLGCAQVEHYYLFLMCAAIRIVYSRLPLEKKLVILNVLGLAMVMTRPVLAPVYLTILVYSLVWFVRNRGHWRRLIGVLLLPVVVLSINVAVNYRETQEFILLENYSGSDLYTSSRIDAPVTIEEAAFFMDETYEQITSDTGMTMTERNNRFKSLARENIRNHPGVFLKNALLRGYEIFLKAYAWATLYTLAGGILLAVDERKRGSKTALIMLLLNVLLAVVSSFGLSELRYSVVIWPLASIHGAYITTALFRKLRKKRAANIESLAPGSIGSHILPLDVPQLPSLLR